MKKLIIKIFVFILILGIGGYTANKYLSRSSNNNEVKITIPQGYSNKQIAKLLKENHIIKNETFYLVKKKCFYRNIVIQAGNYIIPKNIDLDKLFKTLSHSSMDSVKITIPEGYTNEKIAELLEQKGLISKNEFLGVLNNWSDDNYWFLKGNLTQEHNLEGFLFPDTYFIDKKATGKEIVAQILDQFDKSIEFYRDNLELHKMNIKDCIIVASLIEKEAREDTDRPLIASVIYNRLNKDMPLQIDASILYVIGHKDKLLYKDLEVQSPYNTYLNKGLPPTPICNPGMNSIAATMNAEKTDYLFYVLDSNTNKHVFSKTFEEHQTNVKKYIK